MRQILKKKGYSHGTGKRKEAVAQVRLIPGSGAITVNGMPYEERFNRTAHRQIIMKPMETTETIGRYDVIIKVAGGGIAGQCDAISHGIARALLDEDDKYKPILRQTPSSICASRQSKRESSKISIKSNRKESTPKSSMT